MFCTELPYKEYTESFLAEVGGLPHQKENQIPSLDNSGLPSLLKSFGRTKWSIYLIGSHFR